jgi:hypothetical protein
MAPAPLAAQIGVESLLSNVTDISFSLSCWKDNSPSLQEKGSCINERNGYGVEVLWGLRSIPIGRGLKGSAAAPDTTWEVVEKEVRFDGATSDSTRMYARKLKPKDDPRQWSVFLELGLGYGQFSGFESANPAFDVRGTVREIPSLTLYGTLNHKKFLRYAQPYIGVRTGLIQLHNAQIFSQIKADSVVNPDTVAVFTGGAQAFQLGGVAGIGLELGPAHFFVEGAYHVRRFPSIQWTSGTNRMPADLPRSFDFTGTTISVGVQVHIRDPK